MARALGAVTMRAGEPEKRWGRWRTKVGGGGGGSFGGERMALRAGEIEGEEDRR
jgi:hypothetical protein